MSSNDEAVEERIYTIPLRRAWIAPIKKRAPRAMNLLREFIGNNMKATDIIIGSEVNENLWSRGIEGPPRKIRVRAVRDENNIVRVHLVKGE